MITPEEAKKVQAERRAVILNNIENTIDSWLKNGTIWFSVERQGLKADELLPVLQRYRQAGWTVVQDKHNPFLLKFS